MLQASRSFIAFSFDARFRAESHFIGARCPIRTSLSTSATIEMIEDTCARCESTRTASRELSNDDSFSECAADPRLSSSRRIFTDHLLRITLQITAKQNGAKRRF
jgi:hypothetical protein